MGLHKRLIPPGWWNLVDTADLKSAAERCGGSNPPPGTTRSVQRKPENEMTRPTCRDCIHFDPFPAIPAFPAIPTEAGLCRAHAPRLVPDLTRPLATRWPSVDADDWCGELVNRPATKED